MESQGYVPPCPEGASITCLSRHDGLSLTPSQLQGTDISLDAYSAFASPEVPDISSSSSSHPSSISPLTQYLRSHSITRLVICGIATDVCVHATVKDALAEGFKVILLEEACKGVSGQDSEKAVQKMRENGVEVVGTTEELKKSL